MRVNAVKLVKGRDISDDSNVITVKKHNFACVFVEAAQIRLLLELVMVRDARGQIRR